MDVAATVVADEQSFELVEPGEGALDHPAVTSEPRAVLGASVRDLWSDSAFAELTAMVVVVVAAVGGEARRPPPRPASLAAYRRHALDERDQLGDVVAVAARNAPGERDPGRVDQEVVLGA